MDEKKCINCGNKFTPKNNRQKFCSPKCQKEHTRKKAKMEKDKNWPSKRFLCAYCGKRVDTSYGTGDRRTRFCSEECQIRYWKHNRPKKITTSEWAEIIKSEYDKLKNPGRRNDLKKYNNAQNPIDAICQVFGKSKKVIQRYLRITYLTDEFKELVDKGVIRPYIAASISFLSENEQRVLYKILASNNVKLKIDLADALKKASKDIKPKELNERDILNIFQEFKDIKESEKRT